MQTVINQARPSAWFGSQSVGRRVGSNSRHPKVGQQSLSLRGEPGGMAWLAGHLTGKVLTQGGKEGASQVGVKGRLGGS